jgi:hypothetical protein
MHTAVVPLLVIAPNAQRFRLWCQEHGLSPRLVQFVHRKEQLRGIADRHLIIVDTAECPQQLTGLACHVAGAHRLTIHDSTTRHADLTGEELRARYGDQATMLPGDAGPLLRIFGRDDIDPRWPVAFRYATMEALDAFAAGNRRHYGFESIGPLIGPDGAIYGVIILKPPDGETGEVRAS